MKSESNTAVCMRVKKTQSNTILTVCGLSALVCKTGKEQQY